MSAWFPDISASGADARQHGALTRDTDSTTLASREYGGIRPHPLTAPAASQPAAPQARPPRVGRAGALTHPAIGPESGSESAVRGGQLASRRVPIPGSRACRSSSSPGRGARRADRFARDSGTPWLGLDVTRSTSDGERIAEGARVDEAATCYVGEGVVERGKRATLGPCAAARCHAECRGAQPVKGIRDRI
jgi:hypothetical protein